MKGGTERGTERKRVEVEGFFMYVYILFLVFCFNNVCKVKTN